MNGSRGGGRCLLGGTGLEIGFSVPEPHGTVATPPLNPGRLPKQQASFGDLGARSLDPSCFPSCWLQASLRKSCIALEGWKNHLGPVGCRVPEAP